MILSRVKFFPQQRLDLEGVLTLLSGARTDSKLWTKQFLSSQNYVIKGFSISGLGLKSATVAMTDATFIIGGGTSDFSYFIAEPGAADIVIPDSALVDGVRNYVELALGTIDGSPVTVAFWDPSANGGLGAEFNQTVNTVTDLNASLIVVQGGFTGLPDRLPVAIIDCDNSGTIKVILDKRNLFHRLATNTNPDNDFAWSTREEPTYSVNITSPVGTFVAGETVTFTGGVTATVAVGGTSDIQIRLPSAFTFTSGNTITGATSSATGTVNTIIESFTGSDKDLLNAKENDDAIKTEIKRAKGTRFWTQDPTGTLNGISSAINSVIVGFSSGATFAWDGSALQITDSNVSPLSTDILGKIRLFGKNQQINLARQDGQDSTISVPIADGEVLFVKLPTSGDRTYSGVGSGDTNYQIASLSSFTIADENYWIAYREGSVLSVRAQGDLSTGETAPIGDTVPTSLLNNIGLADEETPANYSSNIRGTNGESLVSRLGVLTDSVGDEQEDRSGYLRSDQQVTWDGTNLTFTADIILEFVNTKSGTLTQHKILAAQSPIAIGNGDSIYAEIDRTSSSENLSPVNSNITPIPAQSQADKDIFIFFRRVDAGGVTYLHIPFMKQLISEGQSIRLGQSGSGSGAIKVSLYDPTSTTLPSGPSVTIDGVIGSNGDTVLFTNLGSGNNEIYTLGGVGVSITWTPVRAFNGQFLPTNGDEVIVLEGVGFANSTGEFNGTTFKFNDVVRFYNGVDYWELTSLKTLSVLDNTTASVFSVAASGSENMIMNYSVIRNGKKETGSVFITHDGTNVATPSSSAQLSGGTGVTFSGSISLGVLSISYTSDSQSVGGTLKYFLYRWSDSAGGPGGPPNYSASNVGVSTTSVILADNTASPAPAITLDKTIYRFNTFEYSILRNGIYRTGRFLLTNDGTAAAYSDDFVETAASGIILTADVSGSDVRVLFTSTNTGFSATLKYSVRRWN